MAKIDTTMIEGYETMSAEDKLKALEAFEFEIPKADNTEADKLKAALSKANSEAAEWKRQFREKQTEAERAEAEQAEKQKAMMDELTSLRREKETSSLIAQFMSTGYDKDLAAKAAEAMVDGRTADVISIQTEFLTQKQKELEAAALNKQPTLSTGAPPTSTQAETEAQNKMRSYFGLPPIK